MGQSRKYLRNIIYGNPNNSNYDGLHLRGEYAQRHYTYRAIMAIKPVIRINRKENLSPPSLPKMHSRRPAPVSRDKSRNFHDSCPQARYQSRQSATNHSRGHSHNNQSEQPSTYSDAVKFGKSQSSVSNRRQGHYYEYAVPTSKFFNQLN